MNRRQLLLAFTGLAMGGGVAAASLLHTEASAVEAVIYKRLSYLSLDSTGVRQFAREYVTRAQTSVKKLRVLSMGKWLYARTPQSWVGVVAPGFSFGEERIVSAFLLSSDFFPECDGARPVRYLAFFDGRLRANPFAKLVEVGDR